MGSWVSEPQLEYEVIYVRGEIGIRDHIDYLLYDESIFKKPLNKGECLICFENKGLQLNCKHFYCKECIYKCYMDSGIEHCCYCFKEYDNIDHFNQNIYPKYTA